MTREQVMSSGLSEIEKKRAESVYRAQSRFKKKTCVFDSITSTTELHKKLKELEDNYQRRNKKKSGIISDDLDKAIRDAFLTGMSEGELIEAIKSASKEKHNSWINAQIEELKRQLL